MIWKEYKCERCETKFMIEFIEIIKIRKVYCPKCGWKA